MDNPDALAGRTDEELKQLIRGLQATVAKQQRRIEALEQRPVERVPERWSARDNEPGPRPAPRSL